MIVPRPGIMQQSLRASLAACDGIIVIASPGDSLTALRLARQHQPGLLVINSNLLDKERGGCFDRGGQSEQPAIRCLVFVRSSQGKRRY